MVHSRRWRFDTHELHKRKDNRKGNDRAWCWWNLQDLKSFHKMIGKRIGSYSNMDPWGAFIEIFHHCCRIQIKLRIQLPSCKNSQIANDFAQPRLFNLSAMYIHLEKLNEFSPKIVMSSWNFIFSSVYFFLWSYPCKFSNLYISAGHYFHFSVRYLDIISYWTKCLIFFSLFREKKFIFFHFLRTLKEKVIIFLFKKFYPNILQLTRIASIQ